MTNALPHTHSVAVKGQVWRNGKLLIIKRHPEDDYYPGVWDVPGGGLYKGETAMDGLRREVREEAGIEIARIRPLSTWSHGEGAGFEIGISFLATTDETDITLSEEHTDFAWMAPDTVDRYEFPPNLEKEIRWVIAKDWHLPRQD